MIVKSLFSILVIFLSLGSNLLSQGLINLDQKFGVNKFRLEDLFSKYKNDCKYESTDNEHIKKYTYTGTDVKKVFNYIEIENVNLFFYNEKLMKIHLILGNTTSQNEDYLLNELSRLFDRPNRQFRPDQYTDFSYAWVTEKTELFYLKYKATYSVGPQTIIDVLAYKLYMESQNDRF